MTSCASTSFKREEPGSKVEIEAPLAIGNFENEKKVKETVTLRKLSLPLQIAAIVSNTPKAQRIYRKIPKTSPGAYIFQRPFLRGFFLEGLTFGGAYLWREICLSKSIGLAI